MARKVRIRSLLRARQGFRPVNSYSSTRTWAEAGSKTRKASRRRYGQQAHIRIMNWYGNPSCCNDTQGSTPPTTNAEGAWFNNQDRFTNEIKKVASVSGNTVTFDSPLTTNYRVSHAAQLYSFSTAFTQQAGIESLTTQYADNTVIDFYYCAYCWANMVEVKTYLGGGGHGGIDIENSFRDQLEEVYVHQAAYPVPGGGGYNISLAWFSSEILVENSISMIANKVDVAEGCGAGSVFAYNYFDDGFIGGDGSWVETGIGGSHHIGSHHMLFEGNLAFDADNDGT